MAMKKTEYMCAYCGTRTTRYENQGRPMPGKCPKKKNGKRLISGYT